MLGSGCSQPAHPDVVIVLFDTLRRDHVGTYGYERDTTPTIDAIAREGLVFDRAVAQSSWTRPSVASLFTSRYHSDFHHETYLSDESDWQIGGRLPDAALTMAEIFSANGYRTVSVTTNTNLRRKFNLDQGFEETHVEISAPADWVVDRALESIEEDEAGRRRPLFLYLHFMEPHLPLDPPEPYASMFPTLDGRPHKRGQKEFFAFSDYATTAKLRSYVFKNYRSHVLALYDGSIRFGDAEIGRLVARLRDAGRWEDTLFVFVADHGESFWDRPLLEKRLGMPSFLFDDIYGVGHGSTLFPEQVDVPLILHGPGVPKGRVPQQVRLIDLAPTLLSLAGISDPDFDPRGEPLVAKWRAGELFDRLASSETRTQWNRQRSIQSRDFQYIRVDGERELLFDKRDGRFEEITGERPAVLDRLRAELEARTSELPIGAEESGESVGPAALDPQLCRELADLGYIEPGACESTGPAPEAR
jgi:arylsulfatase A-like enzyme